MADADDSITPGEGGNDAAATAADNRTEKETQTQPEPADRSAIYVDDSAPATLRYSEELVSYPTTREAINAWLALPPEIKKDALITTTRNGARYHGWAIYRLWGR